MMKFVKAACLVALLGLSTASQAQSRKGRLILRREWAAEELQAALKDSSQPKVLAETSQPLPDSTTAVQVAEPIVFRAFGKKNILDLLYPTILAV